MTKRWKVDYFTKERQITTLHETRESAMKRLYDHLDLAQRDAIKMHDVIASNWYGQLRGAMASVWRDVTRGRVAGSLVYQNDVARITRT